MVSWGLGVSLGSLGWRLELVQDSCYEVSEMWAEEVTSLLIPPASQSTTLSLCAVAHSSRANSFLPNLFPDWTFIHLSSPAPLATCPHPCPDLTLPHISREKLTLLRWCWFWMCWLPAAGSLLWWSRWELLHLGLTAPSLQGLLVPYPKGCSLGAGAPGVLSWVNACQSPGSSRRDAPWAEGVTPPPSCGISGRSMHARKK